MRQVLSPVIAGLGSGLTIAVLTGPLLRSLLFHVNPTNPAVLVSAVATVGVAAVCASLGPAHRATRTDPLRALRTD
jgi:ABC-type antimicrobial peptide transport system permease subunit